jgi:hypothetical protein
LPSSLLRSRHLCHAPHKNHATQNSAKYNEYAFDLSPLAVQKILEGNCTDLKQLQEWVTRAVTITRTSDLFD